MKPPEKRRPGRPKKTAPAPVVDTAPTQPKLPENKFPVVVKSRGGRPSEFNSYVGDLICQEMAEGKSLRKICAQENMPEPTTIYKWIRQFPQFAHQYALAQDDRTERHIDEIIEIADDTSNDTIVDPETGAERANSEWIARSRLRVDTRKWIAGKLKAKKYGDKVVQEITGANGGPVQTAAVVIQVSDLEPDARDAIRQALLLTRKPEGGEDAG